jgi:sarcosine oxidase delta subunit
MSRNYGVETEWHRLELKCPACGKDYTILEVLINSDAEIAFSVVCVYCGESNELKFGLAETAFRAFKFDVADETQRRKSNGEKPN